MPFLASEALPLLRQAHAHQRLAHAYLITGPQGSGKRTLALALCAHLLDCSPEKAPLHPDVHSIAPESKSRALLIDQIRELEQKLQMRSATGGKKFGILHDADRLSLQAANAFLKTLEEPPPDTHLLLLTAQPNQLLETILSRCVEVPLRLEARPLRSSSELNLLALLDRFFATKTPSLASGLWLAQQFQSVLADAKEALKASLDQQLKQDAQRYKQSAYPKWLEKQEELAIARTESAYIAERNRLLETLEALWSDVLRIQSDHPASHLPECAPHTTKLAAELPLHETLRRVAAISKLREHLSMSGVSEPLALEYAFLQAFAPQTS